MHIYIHTFGSSNRTPRIKLKISYIKKLMVIDHSTSEISAPSSSSSSWWLRGKVIGRGCFGTVNLAVNKSDGNHIFAVKSVDRTKCIPRQLESLENEIRILRSVSSPHIVRFLGDDVTREGTGSFRNLHMEYMPRGTLADVAGQDLEEHVIRRFTWCLVSALKHLHACGFVHCDVKARNVLLGEDPGSAKLADFGSGLEIRPGNGNGTGFAAHILPRGSPLWMAPEVLRGEYQGPESDVWSLGCTIVEMITGKPPWNDDGAETLRIIGFSDELPKFPARLSEIGRDFLGKCLRRDPSERWSCDQLLQHPFLSSSALSVSPRHVFDWADSVFEEEEEEAVVSEPVPLSESNRNSTRDRIGQLAMSRGVIWESDGWLVVRGSDCDVEETRQLVSDFSCPGLVTVSTRSSYLYHPTWQVMIVEMAFCPNSVRYMLWQNCKYEETKRKNVNAPPQCCGCGCGVPQNGDLAVADPAMIVSCSSILLLYTCYTKMFINKIIYLVILFRCRYSSFYCTCKLHTHTNELESKLRNDSNTYYFNAFATYPLTKELESKLRSDSNTYKIKIWYNKPLETYFIYLVFILNLSGNVSYITHLHIKKNYQTSIQEPRKRCTLTVSNTILLDSLISWLAGVHSFGFI